MSDDPWIYQCTNPHCKQKPKFKTPQDHCWYCKGEVKKIEEKTDAKD